MATSQNDLDSIYNAKKYVKVPEIHWIPNMDAYKLEVPVLLANGEALVLKGNYNPFSRRDIKYSFSLLYKSNILIRRWDAAPHSFKAPMPHKHKQNKECYVVNDICIDNVNKALDDFLIECNIEFKGEYQHIEL